jgi:hypothetical protein
MRPAMGDVQKQVLPQSALIAGRWQQAGMGWFAVGPVLEQD